MLRIVIAAAVFACILAWAVTPVGAADGSAQTQPVKGVKPTPPQFVEPPVDPLVGEYEGTLEKPGSALPVKAQAKVIGDADGKFRVAIFQPLGQADVKPTRIEIPASARDDGIEVTGEWTGKITKDTLTLRSDKVGQAQMKRVERTSPTLGAKPPAGAVVLLPFEEGKPTNLDEWAGGKWAIEPDGSVRVNRTGDITTKRQFGSFKLHVEFRCANMPSKRGQARGNSGVYLHGRYEVQVLDSFGLGLQSNECAGIYTLHDLDTHAALPPGQWQTYDIDFKAPQFDDAGKQVKGGIITVLFNGIKVHDAFEATKVTGGAVGGPGKTGPLRLQDHNGDPVRFRNIWLVEEK